MDTALSCLCTARYGASPLSRELLSWEIRTLKEKEQPASQTPLHASDRGAVAGPDGASLVANPFIEPSLAHLHRTIPVDDLPAFNSLYSQVRSRCGQGCRDSGARHGGTAARGERACLVRVCRDVDAGRRRAAARRTEPRAPRVQVLRLAVERSRESVDHGELLANVLGRMRQLHESPAGLEAYTTEAGTMTGDLLRTNYRTMRSVLTHLMKSSAVDPATTVRCSLPASPSSAAARAGPAGRAACVCQR